MNDIKGVPLGTQYKNTMTNNELNIIILSPKGQCICFAFDFYKHFIPKGMKTFPPDQIVIGSKRMKKDKNDSQMVKIKTAIISV